MDQEYLLPDVFENSLVGSCMGEDFRVWLASKIDNAEDDESETNTED